MLIPTYKQTRVVPVSYEESGLKLLFTFQVWARLFLEVCIFVVLITTKHINFSWSVHAEHPAVDTEHSA